MTEIPQIDYEPVKHGALNSNFRLKLPTKQKISDTLPYTHRVSVLRVAQPQPLVFVLFDEAMRWIRCLRATFRARLATATLTACCAFLIAVYRGGVILGIAGRE